MKYPAVIFTVRRDAVLYKQKADRNEKPCGIKNSARNYSKKLMFRGRVHAVSIRGNGAQSRRRLAINVLAN